YENFDSRGNPTVYATVECENGAKGSASVPSGASTGSFEAAELRDKGERLFGKGVRRAVENINTVIAPKLVGMTVTDQAALDKTMCELDGSENKSNLGANGILAVSMAAARAAAKSQGVPLYKYLGAGRELLMPRPMMNIINGGAHADNNLDIQEFMIQPVKPQNFSESMDMCVTVYHTLKALLKEKGFSTAVGDEGGFAPDFKDDREALEFIVKAIEKAGFTTNDIKICLDAATSEWATDSGLYKMPKRKKTLDRGEMIDMWADLVAGYPIVSLEDGLGESDFEGFTLLTEKLGSRLQLVGDDLFVTNEKRLQQGIDKKAANAILIKPNQLGSVSETMCVIKLAQENGFVAVISHRSGETEDTFISDLALAVSAGQIKTGAPCRSERLAKYNRLLLIENGAIQ
ncbi:MAG: phosphopyruvate hydratase, partial [Clostridia bacterium]|nr:phosphopyruvate hydratase [Clostridia bacterium]